MGTDLALASPEDERGGHEGAVPSCGAAFSPETPQTLPGRKQQPGRASFRRARSILWGP